MASIQVRKETGTLIIDFYWQGKRYREQTLLPDTPANRKRLEKVLAKIQEAIALGIFNYREFFPNSKYAAKLDQAVPDSPLSGSAQAVGNIGNPMAKQTPLFKDFAEVWYGEKSVEWRNSHKNTVRDDIDKL